MYFATQDNPAVDAVIAEVPDSTGVLGSGFTPPIGGNGDPNDPSNFPDAYDNSWMFNSNDVDGVSGRPIIASLDDKIFQDYATAREIALPGSQNPYPSGGGGIAFGSPAFGTAVGYIHGGHFKQILVGGLIGGTELVFDSNDYGMGTVYFPAYDHDISMWKAMTSAYVPLRDKLARGEISTILYHLEACNSTPEVERIFVELQSVTDNYYAQLEAQNENNYAECVDRLVNTMGGN